MGILTWLGRRIGLTDGAFWRLFYSGESWAGKHVNAETALQNSTYWACVNKIATVISTLPCIYYEKRPDGSREPLISDELYSVLHDKPNPELTAVEFWEGMVASICVWGNGYAEKVFGSGENVSALLPLATQCTTPFRDESNKLWYRFNDRGKSEKLPPSKVFHVKGFGFGCDMGLSPLHYARQTIGLSLATDEAAARTFANGMRPGGFFTYDKLLTPAQREQAKKVLIEPYMGSENASKVGILEAGFKWQDVAIPPETAQLLESRGFNVEEICRAFGVPPILVGHASAGQTMWGTGVEQIMIGWLTLGLRPYLRRIEKAISRSLIPLDDRPRRYAEFLVEELLRGDMKSQAEFFEKMVQNGIMTRNEVRAKMNMPKKPSGDDLTVNSANIALQRLGASPAPAAIAAPSGGKGLHLIASDGELLGD